MTSTNPTRAHRLVLGNEKGGSGKSTTAMHVIVALLRSGLRVGALDLDGRQRTLTRYHENRAAWAKRQGVLLPLADHHVLGPTDDPAVADAAFSAALDDIGAKNDVIVIDCPGADTPLARLGHRVADTLLTPMNDSFVDFDLLGAIDPETMNVVRPSFYAELVFDARKRRAMADRGKIDWVVMRNRLNATDARNKKRVAQGLESLAPRVGFRLAAGLSERVIFRELFPFGLTLMDLPDAKTGIALTMSHVAARQEIRELVQTLNLPMLRAGLD